MLSIHCCISEYMHLSAKQDIKKAITDFYHSYKEAIEEEELLDADKNENEDIGTDERKMLSRYKAKMLDYEKEGDASVVRIDFTKRGR